MTPRTATAGPGGAAVGDGTVVPWWSFGKTVLAAAALTLVRDGKADLDTPVLGTATLAQLLQHRAGLPCYTALPAYHQAVAAGGDTWPVDDLLAAVGVTVDRSVWRYSNVGYLHVRRFLEARCDASLGDILAERVFAPLGFRDARLSVRRETIAGLRPGYDPNWVYHGLIVGPLRDAALLLHRLATGALLPPRLLAAMRAPFPVGGPIADRPWRAPAYGLGLMLEAGAPPCFGHTGGGPDSSIAVYHDVAAGLTRAAFVAADAPGAVERATLPSPECSE